ncbi:TonB family protein [Marinimicrobium koreense]|uniref:TonB family protein n=1 Tax=Marinimicrobium koreense TaxID=306545 RepID=A0A3N1NK38_9GAMM|nr:TonB family protein [Marinimicrobium koreense]ROQ20174.1 TonB family protein [Marinimicrobium koreense]
MKLFNLLTTRAGLLSGLMLLLLSSMASASLQSGLSHYDAERYEPAYHAFRRAAEQGNHQAQLNLGVMYLKGQHVERDLVESYAWIALSAQSETLAQEGTHDLVFSHLNEAQQEKAVARHKELEDEFGNAALLKKMQPTFSGTGFSVKGFRPVYAYAPEYPRSAARRGREGWVDFMFTIEKDGTTSDHVAYYSSDESFTDAAMEVIRGFQFEPTTIDGEPAIVHGATYRFVFVLDEGKDHERRRGRLVDRHLSKVREQAATGEAQNQFAFAYLTQAAFSYGGEHYISEENRQNPNDWFMKAARQGHSSAGFFLGRNILYGDACEADPRKSHFWLLQSANDGVADAQYMLALELFSGARFEQNTEQAIFWLKEAASQKQAARLRYAWLLATHPDDQLRDGALAQSLWDTVDEDYPDRQRYYMTAAAIAAEQGDFKQAVRWQSEVVEDAEALKLPMTQRKAHLALYQEGKALRKAP